MLTIEEFTQYASDSLQSIGHVFWSICAFAAFFAVFWLIVSMMIPWIENDHKLDVVVVLLMGSFAVAVFALIIAICITAAEPNSIELYKNAYTTNNTEEMKNILDSVCNELWDSGYEKYIYQDFYSIHSFSYYFNLTMTTMIISDIGIIVIMGINKHYKNITTDTKSQLESCTLIKSSELAKCVDLTQPKFINSTEIQYDFIKPGRYRIDEDGVIHDD